MFNQYSIIYLDRNLNSNNHFHIDHIAVLEHWIYMGIDLIVNYIEVENYHYDVVCLLDDNYKLLIKSNQYKFRFNIRMDLP
jgi:hypothetical protein